MLHDFYFLVFGKQAPVNCKSVSKTASLDKSSRTCAVKSSPSINTI